jgi:RNA polymerase sporulation-specific sigma factor
VEEIAREMGVKKEEVVFALDAIADPISLFEPVFQEGGDTVCVMDQVRDTKNTDDSWIEQISIKQALSELSPREKRIMALRFYEGHTQMEVAREVGISQAQVSRLEKGVLDKIKSYM